MLSWSVYSQEDSVSVVSTEQTAIEFVGEQGVFVMVGNQFGNLMGSSESTAMLGVGIMHRNITAGFELHDFDGSDGRRLIFPNLFFLKYRFGALFTSYQFWDWKILKTKAFARVGMGDLVWQSSNGENRFRDRFYLFEPGVELEVRPVSFLRFFGQIGYRSFHDLTIVGVKKSDLSGVALSLGLRVGFFRKITNKEDEDQ